jgi:alanine dehydrogenase
MLVGVPKEIKDNEYRVGIVPSTVRELAEKGHPVMIQTQTTNRFFCIGGRFRDNH